jgi:hypothetical protein
MTDWRENKRESFQRHYTFQLRYLNFPGMVYSMLPAVAEAFDLDEDGRAWLAWLNGNTQNVVTSMLLLEAAPRPEDWRGAVDFWNDHFKELEWDTDRRHQKNDFGKATERWANTPSGGPSWAWFEATQGGWEDCWKLAINSPFMGRISAWSYLEFARILLPFIPDVGSWFLKESSSRSHRNALCMLSGYDDAWGWDKEQAEIPFMLDLLPGLHDLAEDLLREAQERNPGDPNVTRLTLESALCTFKSFHKPDRRYPNVYADMMYERIQKAEQRMGRDLRLLWDIRGQTLPKALLLEHNPLDPGLVPVKQNWYRETGELHYLHTVFPDMDPSGFEYKANAGDFGVRKDKKWS